MIKAPDHSIEGQKLFPLFAWAILLMFTGFVYLLTAQLQKEASSQELSVVYRNDINKIINIPTTTPKEVNQ